jgi:hypothetical protein
MTAHPERQLARLRARFTHEARQLAEMGFLLKGTLLQRFKRCSSPGCGCQTDPQKRHGPYWQWSHKVDGKTVSRALSSEQAQRYREWLENANRFEALVQELYELSAQADEILRGLEREAAPASKKSTRRKPSRGTPRS